MITQRLLPPEEWARLAGTEAETVWPHLSPGSSRVIVVEDGDAIVATWVVSVMVQAECLWVEESRRGEFGVVKRLLRGMRAVAGGEFGASHVLTRSLTAEVSGLIERFGGRPVPGDHFVLPVEMPRRAAVEA